MKKHTLLILLISALIPGCFDRNKGKAKEPVKKESGKNGNIPLSGYHKKAPDRRVFDDEVEAFVLQEEEVGGGLARKDRQVTLAQGASSQGAFTWVDADTDSEFQTIHFDWDRYNIRKDQKAKVADDIKIAKKASKEGKEIVLEGHADKIGGTETYNMILSERRGWQVAKEFTDAGISRDQIKVVGRGNTCPKVLTGDKTTQEVNRRVEIHTIAG